MKLFLIIFASIFFGVPNQCFPRVKQLKFNRLTTNEGLSQSHVTAILKDNRGFMWFGTEDGLNKFDGYKFTHYKHLQANKSTVADSYIKDLLEDKKGNLWVATANGLDRFDREKNTFVHYRRTEATDEFNDIFLDSKNRIFVGTSNGLFLFDPDKGTFKSYQNFGNPDHRIQSNYVSKIAEDATGFLWIATDYGLYRMDPVSGEFVSYFNDLHNEKSLGANWIKTVYYDGRGNIWIGTHGGGLSLYMPKTNSFRNFRHDERNPNSIIHNDILSISNGVDGSLWIGTENGGVSIYDRKADRFSFFRHAANDNSTISNNSVYCVYMDNAANMWFGTYAGGVNFLPKFGEKFVSYRFMPGNENGLSNDVVLSISGDRDEENLWIGTDGGGLDFFNRKTKKFSHFRHDPSNINSLSNNYVISIIQYSDDVLGLGFHNGGFDLFNTKTGKFTHYLPALNPASGPSISDINNLFKDRNGNVWLGTWKGGLSVFDSKTGKFTHYRYQSHQPGSLSNDIVTGVFQDKSGKMWVGTDRGLNLFDPATKQFKGYYYNSAKKSSISSNNIQSFADADNGNLWVGTVGGGLNYFDVKNETFKTYTEQDGLASNVVFAILRDRRNNLWLSTNKGVSRFDPQTGKFRNFGISDGLQGNEFRDNSRYQTRDGQMFFGGVNGFSSFYPDSLLDNDFVPPVYITDFHVFNKEVPIGGDDAILSAHISETRTLTLSHKQSVFTFEFAALSFTAPERNEYAYKLEGFDNNWNFIGGKRTATYTNLDPGTYTFKVKASNNDGVWNEEGTSVTVIILPPFWLTWWFKFGALLLVAGILVAYYKSRTYSIRKTKRELEFLVGERTRQLERAVEEERRAVEKADMANRAKSSFLATMSHEIRTPMNGVIGLANLLTETELTAEQRKFTEAIQLSGEGLLAVINDILDFSKIESGNMELVDEPFNVADCVQGVWNLFLVKAVALGLDLRYTIDPRVPAQISGDSFRLRQVLINLVGNAIKFTKVGTILLHVYPVRNNDKDQVVLGFDVNDTGIGIEDDKIERLFKAFSQVDSSTSRQFGGSGLGLVISEKLVNLMGGTIRVASRFGEGSTFHFSIRVTKIHLAEPEIYHSAKCDAEACRVLILSQDDDRRKRLHYAIENVNLGTVTAASTTQALEIFKNEAHFDLVLMDVFPRILDSVDAAVAFRKIKAEIPIILLDPGNSQIHKDKSLQFNAIIAGPDENTLMRQVFIELNRGKKNAGNQAEEPGRQEKKLSVHFSNDYPLSILVAEDHKVNQIVIMSTLKKLGYSVTLVENGLEALEAVATASSFDVILMDVQMPKMDGIEACKNIKAKFPAKPYIIAMTANALQQDKEMCLEAGMDDYISKPVEIEELMKLLRKWSGEIPVA
jgi:signal transduction histidine kinase/ligand-binding sensor domain-containing protein/DNA-binding response OmpR family regulator